MEFVKSQFDRIQRQLNGLSASQKMLTAALVAIMVMTLMMWGRYAGEAEYVPILQQSFSQDELSRVTTELTSKGIVHKVEGGRILVPEDRRVEALAHISYGQMLPSSFSASFDEVVKSLNPFESSSVSNAKLAQAKNRTLGLIIGAFDPVKQAVVVIDANTKRSIGGDVEPTATITILMKRPGATSAAVIQKTVNSAADVVMGAQAGVRPDRIKVNVDGVPCKVQNADPAGGMDGNEQLASIKHSEDFYAQKIREHLSFIPSLEVSVTVALNTERKEALLEQYLPNPISVAVEETEENTETKGGGPTAAEPGVATNTGMEVNPASPGGGGNSTTQSSTRSKLENHVSKKMEKTASPAGGVTPLSASVQVPRSYFVNLLKNGKSDAPEPDDKQVQALAQAELPKIKEAVSRCAAFKSDDTITVGMYRDLAGGGMQYVGAPETATAATVSFVVGGHAKEIALGVLAAVSLFMVSMMVRKSTPVPVQVIAPAIGPVGPVTLDTGEELAGEVSGGEAMLEGMELTDEAIKTQQILDQVGTLVNENPDAAATLVKRWMNRT